MDLGILGSRFSYSCLVGSSEAELILDESAWPPLVVVVFDVGMNFLRWFSIYIL